METCLNVAYKLLTGAMTKVLVENNGLVNSIRNGEFDLHPGVTEERNFSGRCPLPSSVRSVHGAVVRALHGGERWLRERFPPLDGGPLNVC